MGPAPRAGPAPSCRRRAERGGGTPEPGREDGAGGRRPTSHRNGLQLRKEERSVEPTKGERGRGSKPHWRTPDPMEGKMGREEPGTCLRRRASDPRGMGREERSRESYSRQRASDPTGRGREEPGVLLAPAGLRPPREGEAERRWYHPHHETPANPPGRRGKGGRGPQPPPRSPSTPPTPTPTHTGKGGTLPPPRRSPHRWSTTTVGVEGFAQGWVDPSGMRRAGTGHSGAVRGR